MSIKTKKISDLNKIEIDSIDAMNGIYLVCSESDSAHKISLHKIASIIKAVSESTASAAVAAIDASDTISEIADEVSKIKAEETVVNGKIIDLEYRVKELETKIKSISKNISDVAADVIAHISKVDDAMKKYDLFFKTIAEEDKITLAKIQEASREVYPVA